ncbi:single-stranded-DNA-specific exonuclease RecJ [Oscillatoriales cyanobacterium LEGE 11467]|uniref:Single-stranded-DNA-specific exonuclease RecJ n=1 Tax=Zarconia navalis LEGE 11467 TaxID=1828826 RepID=A0A928Z602_9CYAN|nr:single-stranded-DNA-specific exonuclease RecJ [Zarconia navalis]MBE9039847.1 single-stranded-DNA-specific exonuclease RecJ [Zarconia navalis LEGE 11467]
MASKTTWQLVPPVELPEEFLREVQRYGGDTGEHLATLPWNRAVRNLQKLPGFLDPQHYTSTDPFEFGSEMHQAVERLGQARHRGEKVTIWGDFDADGITSTSVLWEGLGQFFDTQYLDYYIPNRLKESHGLNCEGIDRLANAGTQLIVTCDTGSTNLEEIAYAASRGIETIVTDHHTLPDDRPPVVAIVNPRYLAETHPLFHLSGVAVAYKLVEALYLTFPTIPQQPLEELLDLVAIGLIADLVQLSGDCRYLAQMGIGKLQQQLSNPTRPGVAKLLELCKRTGDRPTDISFGLGPRINAVSRIQGDASFCVELLTSRDTRRCNELAVETELANARRQELQRDVMQQVRQKLSRLDLSTTCAIVLEDPQWAPGVLGLVAGQIAQEYGQPTILLSRDRSDFEDADESTVQFAVGSARSVNGVDLYQLVKSQSHLLHRFGGHPFAAGLSLPVENIPLLVEGIDRQLRQKIDAGEYTLGAIVEADLQVTVSELGKELFRELKHLEPCGMGNPVPKLLIRNCWFDRVWHRNIQDSKGRKVKYIKTEFSLWDESAEEGFPGIWWGHYKDEIPPGRCDAIVELDYNTHSQKRRYEVRLIAVRSSQHAGELGQVDDSGLQILDWRSSQENQTADVPVLQTCPASWDELRSWVREATGGTRESPIAIGYPPPEVVTPEQVWQQLVGIAKFLARTEKSATLEQLRQKLGIGDRSLEFGLQFLPQIGFFVKQDEGLLSFTFSPDSPDPDEAIEIHPFLEAVREEQFRRQYFSQISLEMVRSMTVL